MNSPINVQAIIATVENVEKTSDNQTPENLEVNKTFAEIIADKTIPCHNFDKHSWLPVHSTIKTYIDLYENDRESFNADTFVGAKTIASMVCEDPDYPEDLDELIEQKREKYKLEELYYGNEPNSYVLGKKVTKSPNKYTGDGLLTNKCGRLVFIDVDNHVKEEKETAQANLVNQITSHKEKGDWYIEGTPRFGLHIPVWLDDGLKLYSNRNIETLSIKDPETNEEQFAIDILGACEDGECKQSLILLAGSKKKKFEKVEGKKKEQPVGKPMFYKVLSGSVNTKINYTVTDLFKILGLEDQLNAFLAKAEVKAKSVKPIATTKPIKEKEDEDDVTPEDVERVAAKKPSLELFDALIDCIADSSVEIHKSSSKKSSEEIAISQLYGNMLWCECDEITDDHIEESLDKIKAQANLTVECKNNWDKQTRAAAIDFVKGKITFKSIGYMVDAAKQNKDKYKNVLLPLLIKLNPKRESFRDSTYTIEDLYNEISTFTTLSQLIGKLRLCLAFHTHGGYIIKQKSTQPGRNIEFQHIKKTELSNIFGDLTFSYPATEEDKQKMRDDKKKVKDTMTIKINKILTNTSFLGNFEKFNGIEMMSSDADVLQLYNPPAKTEYHKQLILDWIGFMKEMINNTEAFDEMLDSHAYRFRHPNEFIEKFFINYGTGNNCKTFLMACIDKIYPNCANVAVQQQQVESDLFNGWLTRNLCIHFEEAQKNKPGFTQSKMEQIVKLMTTMKASARGMYSETRSARNWAIPGMNTNKETLYGLAFADDPSISRLVILDFKDNLKGEIYDKPTLYKKTHDFTNDPTFAYSLYYYLKFDHKISENFCPSRYDGADRQAFIDRVRKANRNSVEDWFVEKYSELIKSAKVKGVAYKVIKETDANTSYREWKRQNRDRILEKGVKDTLIDGFGFEYKSQVVKSESIKVYRMPEDKFNEWKKKYDPDDGDEEMEIEGEE